MKLRMHALSAALAGVMALVVAVPAAHAILNKDQHKCQKSLAKLGGKYLKAALKEKSKCADKNLKETGSCDFDKRDAKLNKAETKLREGLQKKCVDIFQPGKDDESLATIGFPGKCADADPSNGFNGEDLKDCIFDTHKAFAVGLYNLEYGSNGADGVIDFETRDANNAKELGKCQKEIAKNGQKLVKTVQKEISKCRDSLLQCTSKIIETVEVITCKLSGFLDTDCADNSVHTKPGEKIAKSSTKAKDKIQGKCSDLIMGNSEMDACDIGSGPATTSVGVAACIVQSHINATDDPDNTSSAIPFGADIIDVEYQLGASCGDNIVNEAALPIVGGNFFLGNPPEECDGTEDSACPFKCGALGSNFPCLCTDTLRERVIEHDNSDLDNGWTGTSHDSTVVEGGGYVSELYDCDGPGGPDTLCTVGPSCALPSDPNDPNSPHTACSTDLQCLGFGGCRTTSIAVGPHCNDDVQTFCDTHADCPDDGDFCRKTNHGIPLPLSSGGVAVCVINVFSEHVVGTTDLATGSSAIRLRQQSITHIGSGTVNQPCPICGGFCSGTSGGAGPGVRTTCAADSDCPASAFCVTDLVCSYGPNEDQPCRNDGQFGGLTVLFGTPSVDCQPSPGNDISSNGLDILFNPTTTGTKVSLPSLNCGHVGHDFKKCIFGTEVGKTCVVDGDCAGGGAGSCTFQCFCPVTPALGTSQQANGCTAACHGGTNDYGQCGDPAKCCTGAGTPDACCTGALTGPTCTADICCPGGVCEENSCRVAAGVCTGGATVGTGCAVDTDCGVGGQCGDADSSGEGFCASGPVLGLCSFTTLKSCLLDSNCRPSGTCAFCLADESETCVFKNKDCFPSAGYTRTGTPGVPERVGVSHFCIAATGSGAINSVAGLAGPGALEQPVGTVLTSP